jgi:hypothetical protein
LAAMRFTLFDDSLNEALHHGSAAACGRFDH